MVALKRVFVAVWLSDEIRHLIAARLDGVALPGKVVSPDKWHVTLRFIGAVDEVALDRVTAALDEAELGRSFDVMWGGLGAFPRLTKATVLWLGLERGAEGMRELAARVEAALDQAGIPAEDRPFRPHLTLSRIRPPQDVAELVERIPTVGGRMRVRSVGLMESRLHGRSGAEYEVLERFPLA